MNNRSELKMVRLVVMLLLISFSISSAEGEEAIGYDPTDSYKVTEIHGWKVYVQKRLYRQKKEVGKEALAILENQLFKVTRAVPEEKLARLKEVPIWLCDRKDGPIHYHPAKEWLVDNDYNPDKAKAVDISRAENIIRSHRDQPWVMLHELAHAYHDRVISFEDERVIAAYETAKKSGKYESINKIQGSVGRHYALTNHKEYFAECTEAFFGCNDFFPYVRTELREFDPDVYHALVDIWGNDPIRNSNPNRK